MKNRFFQLILILIWITSCNNQESSIKKEFAFQGGYDSINRNDVLESVKESYISNKKKLFETNDEIEEFVAYDFEISDVDTAAVLTKIKLILGSQKFSLNRILPDSLKGGYLEKALKAHDDSLIYFYTNFHGYKIAYYYYVVYRDEEILPRVYKHNLWVDTNSNIVLESIPYSLTILFVEGQPMARDDQRKVFIKKWWPDSLPKDIDSIELEEYFQHKIN